MRLAVTILVALVLGVRVSPGGSAEPEPPDLFDQIYARGRLLEAKMQTVRARFTETTVSSLLAKPVVAKGTLLAAKPPRLRLEYMTPERKTLLMDGMRVVIVWPDRGESETLDASAAMKRVDQYFTKADAGDLRRMFVVRAMADTEIPNSYQIDMVPKRKQIREGLERLQLWADRDSLMLVQMRMTFPGGDTNTMRLEGAEVNVPLGPRAFEIELPAMTKLRPTPEGGRHR